MSAKINVGVAGCGYWGPNLIRNFAALPDCNLKAICDLNTDRLKHIQSLYPGVEAFTDYGKFLTDGQLDAVVVATSVGLHYRMGKAALEAGKHILVEKPLATSSEECLDLAQTAKKNGLILMAGHTFLYSPVVRRIKQIVDKGDIGDIRYISARRLNLGLFQKDINVAWDLAPHDLSIILYIMGELPQRVNCCGNSSVSPRVQDVTSMWLGFSRNRSAIVQSSWLDPRKTREMTIVGSRRMVVYDDTASLEKIRIFDARVDSPPHYDTFAEFHYAYHYGDVYIPYVKQEEPLRIECQHFLDCIKTGHRPISDGEQALQLVRILEASSKSLQLAGAPVDLPPADTKSHGSPAKATPNHPGNGAVTAKSAVAIPDAPVKRSRAKKSTSAPA
ncbi:MAG: Gfo/Idh/MocA family oxidoreductase [Verrucomicrobiales bacterium]|nr:Gfo/Idh/MocA family oxidoreductase [Verrucomicrobiales bacterium]